MIQIKHDLINKETLVVESNSFQDSKIFKSKFDKSILIGRVILSKYKIVRALETRSSESYIYYAIFEDSNYIVKVYTDPNHFSSDTADFSSRVNSIHIMQRVEPVGKLEEGYQFEVFKFYKNGTLGETRNLEKYSNNKDFIKYYFVPQMNNALHELHLNGYVHGDFKPDNIYIDDDGETLVLGDFGNIVNLQGSKYAYNHRRKISLPFAAQESVERLSSSSDYFSLGMSLIYLGDYTYYQGKTDSQVRDLILTDETIINDVIDDDVAGLITMLINPSAKKRIGFKEVEKWCTNFKIFIGAAKERRLVTKKLIKQEFFNKKYINDFNELVFELNSNWAEAKDFLKTKKIFNILEEVDFDNYKVLAIKKVYDSKDTDNIKLFLILRMIDPKLKYYWKDNNLGNDFSDVIFYLNRNKDFSDFEFIDKAIFDFFIDQTSDKESASRGINEIFSTFSDKRTILEMIINLFWSIESQFLYGGINYKGIKDFTQIFFDKSGNLNSNENFVKLLKSNLLSTLIERRVRGNKQLEDFNKRFLKEGDNFKRALFYYYMINGQSPFSIDGLKLNTVLDINLFAVGLYLRKKVYSQDNYIENLVANGAYRKIAEVTEKENINLFKLIDKIELNINNKKPIIPLIYFNVKQSNYLFLYENKFFEDESSIYKYLTEKSHSESFADFIKSKKELNEDDSFQLFKKITNKER